VSLGKPDDFQIGKTVAVTVTDPSSLPWAGVTAKSGVWLRRVSEDSFIAFSANCTHLGCPVRWLEGADLFMCPCHGGVYYSDGKVAAGPRRFRCFATMYSVANGEVQMKQAIVPISTTL
jgi:menaquinol-cytochrome c reductase iron-sulfur subunit